MLLLDLIKITILNVLLALATLIPQKSISFGVIGAPLSFLPHEAQITSEKMVSDLVFRKLFKYRDGELVNDLIDSWSVSEDKKVYTLKLKEHIFWQDGFPITSNDIIYTFTMNQSLRDEMDIEKISNQEVRVTLQTPNAILPSLLTFGIEPAHLTSQQKLIPVGSSSYRISRVIMERNRVQGIILQSFQEGKQYNKIYLNFYETDNNLQTAYKLGEISAFISNQGFDYPHAQSQPVTFIGRYMVLIFNTSSPKTESPEIREILAKSINVDDLLKANYFKNSLKAEGPISYSFFTKDIFRQSNYDPELKLSAAQKTIVGDGLKVLLPNNQDGRQMEDFLRQNWHNRLEVNLEVRYHEPAELVDKGKSGEFDVILLGHEVTPDPDRYIFWHSTQIRNLNIANFNDLRADKALEEGRKVFDNDDRIIHYNILQDVIYTKTPAIFLYHPGTFLYTSEKTPIPLPKAVFTPSDILENL